MTELNILNVFNSLPEYKKRGYSSPSISIRENKGSKQVAVVFNSALTKYYEFDEGDVYHSSVRNEIDKSHKSALAGVFIRKIKKSSDYILQFDGGSLSKSGKKPSARIAYFPRMQLIGDIFFDDDKIRSQQVDFKYLDHKDGQLFTFSIKLNGNSQVKDKSTSIPLKDLTSFITEVEFKRYSNPYDINIKAIGVYFIYDINMTLVNIGEGDISNRTKIKWDQMSAAFVDIIDCYGNKDLAQRLEKKYLERYKKLHGGKLPLWNFNSGISKPNLRIDNE